MLLVHLPIEHWWLEGEIHFLPPLIPLLLSLRDMDRLGIDSHNLFNLVFQKSSTTSTKVLLQWYMHSSIGCLHKRTSSTKWSSAIWTGFMATQMFASYQTCWSGRLERTPKKPFMVSRVTTRNWNYCQRFGWKTGRFKFTLRDDSIQLNRAIYCDIWAIPRVPILHVVHGARSFNSTQRLANMTSE